MVFSKSKEFFFSSFFSKSYKTNTIRMQYRHRSHKKLKNNRVGVVCVSLIGLKGYCSEVRALGAFIWGRLRVFSLQIKLFLSAGMWDFHKHTVFSLSTTRSSIFLFAAYKQYNHRYVCSSALWNLSIQACIFQVEMENLGAFYQHVD